jgi:hypothetical protein
MVVETGGYVMLKSNIMTVSRPVAPTKEQLIPFRLATLQVLG